MVMVGRTEFEDVFSKGQIVSSGGPRSKLQIAKIDDKWVSVVPIYSRHKTPVRLYYSQLTAVVDGFAEINPRRIVATINPVLTSRGEKKEHTTENYLYGFARAYLEATRMAGERAAEEIDDSPLLPEGAKKQVLVNGYERSSIARARCIAKHGTACSVCRFDFGVVYGALGEGFIHVHHLKPLANIGREYELDPIRDLRPICPNCHAMVHRYKKALPLKQLRSAMAGKARQIGRPAIPDSSISDSIDSDE